MYRREKNIKKKKSKKMLGWKEKHKTVCGGKEPKELRAQRKWSREKRERQAKNRGGTSKRVRSEEMNKDEKKEVGVIEWKIAALAWGNVKNRRPARANRRMEPGQDKEQNGENATEQRSEGAAKGVVHAGWVWCWLEYQKHISAADLHPAQISTPTAKVAPLECA